MPRILENPKDKILQEGKKILIEKNYAALSIRDVAKASGIGVGTFYNYFSNKDELIESIFIADWVKISDKLDVIACSEEFSLRHKLEYFYKGINEFLKNYMSIFYELTMVKGREKKEDCHMEHIYAATKNILEFHVNKGDLSIKIDIDKYNKLMCQNIIMICREEYISFDELMDIFEIT